MLLLLLLMLPAAAATDTAATATLLLLLLLCCCYCYCCCQSGMVASTCEAQVSTLNTTGIAASSSRTVPPDRCH
eukprot:9947-Heterococcus_DN1.PRE.2